MKRLAAIVVGSLLLVIVAVAIFVATFDVNRYKPEIVKLVHERTGRTLAIDGDLGIAIFPKISATTGRVMLSEVGRAEPFAHLDSARVALALWPLLSRKVVADRIELTGLDVTLVKRRDGSTNFGDLLDKPTEPAKPVAGSPPAPPTSTPHSLAIDVSGVTLKDARIRWHDETGTTGGGGTDVTVAGLTLTTGRIASGVAAKLSLTGTLQGMQPALHLKLGVDTGYRIDFEGRAVDLADLAIKLDGIDAHAVKVVATGAGAANWGKETASVDLKIKIDDANVHAKVNISGYSSPAVQFDVEADRLNFERLNLDRNRSVERAAKPAPADGGPKSDGAKGGGATTSPGTPIDLRALKTLNANGTLRVGAL
ncbi:MAG: AsmA family protein, partial [Burkholderiales bacterium]